jgi:hypothetical protein
MGHAGGQAPNRRQLLRFQQDPKLSLSGYVEQFAWHSLSTFQRTADCLDTHT